MHIPNAEDLLNPSKLWLLVHRDHTATELGGVEFDARGEARIYGCAAIRRILAASRDIESITEVAQPAAVVMPDGVEVRDTSADGAGHEIAGLAKHAGRVVVITDGRVAYVADDRQEAEGFARATGVLETATIREVP